MAAHVLVKSFCCAGAKGACPTLPRLSELLRIVRYSCFELEPLSHTAHLI